MKRLAQIILVLVGIGTIFFTYALKDLEFDYMYEKFFPKDDAELNYFESYRERYGSDNDFLLIGFENEAGVNDLEFLNRVKVFGDSIALCNSVELVYSVVHNCNEFRIGGFEGLTSSPCLELDSLYLNTSWEQLRSNTTLYKNLVSEDQKSLLLFVKTKEFLGKIPSEKLGEDINRIQSKFKFKFDELHISGRILAQKHYVEKMINEMAVFIGLSILVLIIFLYISFKSWWGVVVPLSVVIISMVWTISLMHLTGKSFDLLMVMLPTIIFVVGMSDLIHLLNKYLEELRNGLPKGIALKKAFREVSWATFLTSFTTAIGFFTLMSANIQPIQEFGLYSGIGVFVAYALAFTVFPSVLLLTKVPVHLVRESEEQFWQKYLRSLLLFVLRNRKAIAVSAIVLFLISGFAAWNLQINNFLLEDLSNEDPLKKDFLFFENEFSGVRPFECEIIAKKGNVLDYQTVLEIDKIENYLQTEYTPNGVGFLISPLQFIREGYAIKHNGSDQYRKIPEREKTYNRLLEQANQFKNQMTTQFDLGNMLSADSSRMRVSGKIADVGGLTMKRENEKLNAFISSQIDTSLIEVRLTGTAFLIDKNNETLAKQLIIGLLIAFSIVGLIVGLMFRSLKLALLSLIPNILPLLFVTIFMQIFGIDLKISTSLIFTLAFGIAVDDTIHLLSKYRIELNKGKSPLYALKRSYLSAGKAIIVTTLILCGGFVTLIGSSFMSTYYMGLLVSITLFAALIMDLFLMPILMLPSKK